MVGVAVVEGERVVRLVEKPKEFVSDIALAPDLPPLRLATISPFFAYAVPVLVLFASLAYATWHMQHQDVA